VARARIQWSVFECIVDDELFDQMVDRLKAGIRPTNPVAKT
jgi:CRISPR/Cas system-associated endoribonuclease Cas2